MKVAAAELAGYSQHKTLQNLNTKELIKHCVPPHTSLESGRVIMAKSLEHELGT